MPEFSAAEVAGMLTMTLHEMVAMKSKFTVNHPQHQIGVRASQS